ncbi:metallophosphoesterase family protein [Kineothrix sp. MB12-C1]|uniref:metallophosphoesterase family protein n=1 Tax=Kineothrix sp. MB12-C1 TaxID=3070215 RepID=UPI0027D26E5C|nr:metallophosphoesterase [Kineothrix sp. MB12-C1]WMC93660.1 metallophosphoesterase [Kineothrix sp. MB12-C1]
MRVLIISDTHRQNANYLKVLEQVRPIDMVVHCGDVEGSEYMICESAGCQVEMVTGNNDFFSDLPREREFQIGNYHVWLTHGHNYHVSMGCQIIKEEALARGADIVMYGHTHRPLIDMSGKVIAINPGSLSYPRQEGKRPSYIIMELDDENKAQFTINYL